MHVLYHKQPWRIGGPVAHTHLKRHTHLVHGLGREHAQLVGHLGGSHTQQLVELLHQLSMVAWGHLLAW